MRGAPAPLAAVLAVAVLEVGQSQVERFRQQFGASFLCRRVHVVAPTAFSVRVREHLVHEPGAMFPGAVEQVAELVGIDQPAQFAQPCADDQRLRARCRHVRVPAAQLAQHLLCLGIGSLGFEQQGQDLAHLQRYRVGLDALEALQRMLGRRIQKLLDAIGAIGRAPLAGDVVRIVVGHDLVVGRYDAARGGVVAARQRIEGDEAVPVVFRLPAGRGCLALEVVVGLAQRDAAGRDESDVALGIRIDHVLLRRIEVARRSQEFVPIARGRQFAGGLHRHVVFAQRGPFEREREVLWQGVRRRLEHIGDQRAVARGAHHDRHVRLSLYLDHFAVGRELLPSLRREYPAFAVDAFDVQILHIRAGVGEAPGDLAVASQHDCGHARQRRPHHVESRRRQMREIPDRGGGQAQVRVVGQ